MSMKPWRPGPAPRACAPQTPRMRHFARVCLTGLLHDGKSHEPCGRDIARYVGDVAPDLIDAIGLLRTGKVTGKRFDAMRRQRADMPFEALCAEFAARAAAFGDMGLPPLLVTRPLDVALPAPAGSPILPLAAVRLLAGTARGLFLLARAPSPAQFLMGTPHGCPDGLTAFDYWLAEELEESA